MQAPLKRALGWITRNSIPGQGVAVSARQRTCSLGVTGYLIPTLPRAGEPESALDFARWLVSFQQPDGSLRDPAGGISYVLATGQAIRGWIAVLRDLPQLATPVRKACDWILNSSMSDGRLPLRIPSSSRSLGKRGYISEAVHLYALPPLMMAGELLGEPTYSAFATKSLNYYVGNHNVADFRQANTLTQLFAAIQDALFDLGAHDLARQGMRSLSRFQQDHGGIPASLDVSWISTPGQLQSAVVWYKLAEPDRANAALTFCEQLQNASGGFFGSYGIDADYFPSDEISRAAAVYVDAASMRPQQSLHASNAAFSDSSSVDNGQLRAILRHTEDVGTNVVPEAGLGRGRSAPAATKACSGAEVLSATEWHRAIVGGTTPELVAHKIRHGDVPEWAQPLIDNTKAGERVLELGSGTGELSVLLAYQGRKVTLLDNSQENLDFSRGLFKELGLPGTFVLADVCRRFPYEDGYFDLVWSSGLLEHFDDDQMLHILKESARVSRKRVLSLVPNAGSVAYRLGKWQQEQAGRWPWGKEDPKSSMERLFKLAGMGTVREYSVGTEHAVSFLSSEELLPAARALLTFFRALPAEDACRMNQGYLLATVGEKQDAQMVPNCT